MKLIDITGQKFGTYTAIKRVGSKRGNAAWLCKCDCGKEKVMAQNYLKYREKHGKGCCCNWYKPKHHESQTRLYRIYIGMKRRCYGKYDKRYDRYGGRGITMCDEWLGEYGFVNFRDWSYQNGYQESLSIDRKDNNGNYEPSNCRWVTMLEQNYNRSNTIYITYNGETHTTNEWAEITNLSIDAIRRRYHDGWDIKDVLFKPLGKAKRKPLEYRHIKPEGTKGKIYGYSVRIKGKYMGYYKTIEEAQKARDKILSEVAN